jgi:hypothetical protein
MSRCHASIITLYSMHMDESEGLLSGYFRNPCSSTCQSSRFRGKPTIACLRDATSSDSCDLAHTAISNLHAGCGVEFLLSWEPSVSLARSWKILRPPSNHTLLLLLLRVPDFDILAARKQNKQGQPIAFAAH